MSRKMGFIAMLAILLLFLLLDKWQLEKAKERLTEQAITLNTLNQQLKQERQQSSRNEAALLTLQQQISTANGQLQQRYRQLEQLKHENQQLRDWAATRLPDVVIRLHQHPAVTGSQAYRELPEGRSLPATGD